METLVKNGLISNLKILAGKIQEIATFPKIILSITNETQYPLDLYHRIRLRSSTGGIKRTLYTLYIYIYNLPLLEKVLFLYQNFSIPQILYQNSSRMSSFATKLRVRHSATLLN